MNEDKKYNPDCMSKPYQEPSTVMLPLGTQGVGRREAFALATSKTRQVDRRGQPCPISSNELIHTVHAGHDLLIRNLESARSPGTRQQYEKAWSEFSQRYGNDLPSSAADVAVYLSELGANHAPSTVRLHAAAIAARHTDFGYPSPTKHPVIVKALKGATREAQHVPEQSMGLDIHAFEKIVASAQIPRRTRGGRIETAAEAEYRGIMDIAMIGLMRDGLLRRSECNALIWADLTQEPNNPSGRLLIRRSKTDQTGKGSIRYVSEGVMEVVKEMRIMRGNTHSKDKIIGLSPGHICRRIKSACEQAGLDGHFSGHSPRIGMAIDLARAGVSLPALQEAGRWKKSEMPAHYVRAVEAGSGAVAQWYENG